MRKKKQAQVKKEQRRSSSETKRVLETFTIPTAGPPEYSVRPPTVQPLEPPIYELPQEYLDQQYPTYHHEEHQDAIPSALSRIPFIHDPGDGPRVRDARVFISSSFAAPPSLDDALCAEFAQDEILEMLLSVLPEETALVRLMLCSTSDLL